MHLLHTMHLIYGSVFLLFDRVLWSVSVFIQCIIALREFLTYPFPGNILKSQFPSCFLSSGLLHRFLSPVRKTRMHEICRYSGNFYTSLVFSLYVLVCCKLLFCTCHRGFFLPTRQQMSGFSFSSGPTVNLMFLKMLGLIIKVSSKCLI